MRKGYLLTEIMIGIIIAGTLATVFTTMAYYSNIQVNILKHQNNKIILDVLRSRLLELSLDVDSDSYFELLKEDGDNSIPIQAGIGTDAWGKRIFYSTIDLGDTNDVNASYANTTTSISPNDNILGRLLSAGENGIFETTATDSEAKNDDLMLEIGLGEMNHYKLYGSSEITTETRGYNSAVVSSSQPSSPINGTLWYDSNSSTLKMYNQGTSTWIEVNTTP